MYNTIYVDTVQYVQHYIHILYGHCATCTVLHTYVDTVQHLQWHISGYCKIVAALIVYIPTYAVTWCVSPCCYPETPEFGPGVTPTTQDGQAGLQRHPSHAGLQHGPAVVCSW